MPARSVLRQPPPGLQALARAAARLLVLGLGCLLLALGRPGSAWAQGVELAQLQVSRQDGSLTLDFATRVTLPRAVEEALTRGVPLYFVAEAQLLRNRWYWRDERVARVARSWRIAFQPLTGNWRVGLGGLNQTFTSLPEALAAASRTAGWRLADLSALDSGSSYTVEFSYRLDSSQLPGPMQFGLGANEAWTVGVQRALKVEP